MSDRSRERRGPGPLGTSTNSPVIDRGTLAVTQHRGPGPVGIHHPGPSAWQIAVKKSEYLEYARRVSYLMQGKSAAESAANWIEGALRKVGVGSDKLPRVQSYLGGAFLRMYLDGKKDPSIIADAGLEIAESPEFKRLSEELNKFLQAHVDQLKPAKIDPEKLRALADQHLKHIRATTGIAFRYTLNAVIGGVTGVAVQSVSHLNDVTTPNGTASKYRVSITFFDTYDFENRRHGEYDHFRKELTRYLIANDFDRFHSVYDREAHHPFDEKMHKTHLDNAAVFASFMYALEQKGWTPGGLKWDVTVPTEIILVLKPARHPHSAYKAQAH
jgi:hypothetical protein